MLKIHRKGHVSTIFEVLSRSMECTKQDRKTQKLFPADWHSWKQHLGNTEGQVLPPLPNFGAFFTSSLLMIWK